MKQAVIALVLATASVLAMAQNSPVGLWRTIDDDGKTEKSTVRITSDNGVLSGKVEHITDPAKAEEKCTKCEDDRKDKPIVGMTLIKGVKQSDSDKAMWDGGEILDPNNGKTYKVRLTPIDGGKTLEVRGFIGPFYRNQTWTRVE